MRRGEPSLAIPRLDGAALARFWSRVRVGGADDCWLWQGRPDTNGYGTFTLARVNYRAHRVSVSVAGYAVPRQCIIDHTCRNRMCVNPAHLRTVDRKTNVHENSQALAHLNSLKTECPRGHPLSGENLNVRRGRRTCRACRVIEQAAAYRRRKQRSSAHAVTIPIAGETQ